MVDPNLVSITDCKHLEFGNPSAHSFGCTFVLLNLIYMLNREWSVRLRIKKSDSAKIIVVAMNLGLLLIQAVSISRLVKGVHTYNQVISGFV